MTDIAKSPLTFTDSILNWNQVRQEQESVINALASAGNYFLLDTGNISSLFNTLHIYIGFNNEALQLFALPGIADNYVNLQSSFERYQKLPSGKENQLDLLGYINSKLLPISLSSKKESIQEKLVGEPSPGEQALINSINNWGTDGVIENWVEGIFERGAAENMVQAFDIDISDFKPGQIHACYFALTENRTIDLVIVNTETNQIINLIEDKTNYDNTSQFRDMARPVPPFGQDIFTVQQEFGVLTTLGIS